MMEQISTKRIIEPFVYFPTHASAIDGLGGPQRSPDPNYCLHTHYFEYRPGIVVVHITFLQARATCGELTLRIHGYRPDNQQLGIKLIAADRVQFSDLAGSDHAVTIRFAAIPGVHYAVYGVFSEPSDIKAQGIDMIAEEMGGDDIENYSEAMAPQSLLTTTEVVGVNALIADAPANLRLPSSQACTVKQLESPEFVQAFPEILPEATPEDRWRHIYALRFLDVYGLMQAGARGLLIGPGTEAVEIWMRQNGCEIRSIAEVQLADRAGLDPAMGYFDFVVCLEASRCQPYWDSASDFIDQAVQRTMASGYALLVFDYDYAPRGLDEKAPASTVAALQKGDIERIALRLIGHGRSVAQLNFPSGTGQDRPMSAKPPFGIAIRR